MEVPPLTSCYLMRELFTEQIEESHPIWPHLEDNDYLLELRKTTSHRSCDGQSETRRAEPYFEAYGVCETCLLSDPVDCVSSMLQENGLSLPQSDVQRIASFMAFLSDTVGPGTRVMAVAQVCVCEIMHIQGCAHVDTSSSSEDETTVEGGLADMSEREMMDEEELNSSEWAQATYDMFSRYGSSTTLDEITQWLSGGEAATVVSSGLKLRSACMRYDGTGDDSCAICMDEFSHGDLFVRTACSHNFHQKCIGNWMMRKGDCPLCRAQIQF
uniref:RING-type domain-containing protein n=1 Tax=Kalanchoe fedtschenkoi TaxID=63787 RepID=A0A7N0TSM5_KALFE